MAPKFLYHGTGAKIRSKFIKVNQPTDKSRAENSIFAVYAADRCDIAKGMALTTEKYTKSFGDYDQKPFQAIFVRGEPKKERVYLYKVSSKGFIEKPKGSHQWVSTENVKIISCETFLVKNLDSSWRKATIKEKVWYYKTR